MSKAELKETLKPLIKQCIKEVLFEDGVLSGIISEVVKGVNPQPVVVEAVQEEKFVDPARQHQITEMKEAHEREMADHRRILNETVSSRFGGADLFQGTAPISKAGTPGDVSAPSTPLQGVDPNDPGVDLSRLGIYGK
jgi:hypothetical protein